ncbi:MAG: hypothetical protein ACHQLQ_14835, partial [Candidatus Acidiferrales bacterium]
SNTNRSFSSITLLAFHGMRCFLHALATDEQCQECPRSILSGMCPVCTCPSPPPKTLFPLTKCSCRAYDFFMFAALTFTGNEEVSCACQRRAQDPKNNSVAIHY